VRCDILYIYTERERKESRISIAGAARRHMKAADVLEDMPLYIYIYIYIYIWLYVPGYVSSIPHNKSSYN